MLPEGLTVKVPPVMLNAEIPVAVGVITTGLPAQVAPLFTIILGVILTETNATAVFELRQPLVPVPVTE